MVRSRSKMDNVRGFLLEGLNCITMLHMTFYAQTSRPSTFTFCDNTLFHFTTRPFNDIKPAGRKTGNSGEGRVGLCLPCPCTTFSQSLSVNSLPRRTVPKHFSRAE